MLLASILYQPRKATTDFFPPQLSHAESFDEKRKARALVNAIDLSVFRRPCAVIIANECVSLKKASYLEGTSRIKSSSFSPVGPLV